MARPVFSIIIPTRDRPEYVQYAFQSLILQSFSDFEVIVCDNFTRRSCKVVFDKYADSRFRYVTPPHPMSMHDNWEYAVSQACGEYVAVLIDKTVLRPFALQKTAETIATHPADAYNWRAEAFYLVRENVGDTGTGYYVPCWADAEPAYIDTDAEIQRRLSFDVRLGGEGVHYYYGKICFGVYSRGLIAKIERHRNRIFYGIAPDYTSMASALSVAASIVDIGATLQVSLNTAVSNGMLAAESATYARSFLRTIDQTLQIIHDFQVPGLYASIHNMIAYDYRLMRGDDGRDIDRVRLASHIWDDLAAVKYWPSEEERNSQFGILHAWAHRLPVKEKERLDARLMTIPDPVKLPSFLDNAMAALHKRLQFRGRSERYYKNVIEAIVERDVEKEVLGV